MLVVLVRVDAVVVRLPPVMVKVALYPVPASPDPLWSSMMPRFEAPLVKTLSPVSRIELEPSMTQASPMVEDAVMPLPVIAPVE